MNIDCEECVGCTTEVHHSIYGDYKRLTCIYKHNDDDMNSGHMCEDFEVAKTLTFYEMNDDEE